MGLLVRRSVDGYTVDHRPESRVWHSDKYAIQSPIYQINSLLPKIPRVERRGIAGEIGQVAGSDSQLKKRQTQLTSNFHPIKLIA